MSENRPATRYDEAELLNPPVPEDKPKSGFVILYLAVILVAIATGAIIALLWWGLR